MTSSSPATADILGMLPPSSALFVIKHAVQAQPDAHYTQVSFDLERTKRELSVLIRLSYANCLEIRLSSLPVIYCSQNS